MKLSAGGAVCGTPKNVWLPTRPAAAVSRTPGHRTSDSARWTDADREGAFPRGATAVMPPNLWWLPESSRYPKSTGRRST